MSKNYKREPNNRIRIVAEKRLCFFCLKWWHQFKIWPNPKKKCEHSGCTSSHSSLLQGADRIFPRNNLKKGSNANNAPTTQSSSSVRGGVKNKLPSQSSLSSYPSVSYVKGLLQVKQVERIIPTDEITKFSRYVIPHVVIHGLRMLQLSIFNLWIKVSDYWFAA